MSHSMGSALAIRSCCAVDDFAMFCCQMQSGFGSCCAFIGWRGGVLCWGHFGYCSAGVRCLWSVPRVRVEWGFWRCCVDWGGGCEYCFA